MGLETIAIAAVAASAVGAGVSFYGQQQQAKAAEATADYNAQLARNQAAHETEAAAENARRKARENARIIGLQREAIAASGMASTGTPLALLGETVMSLERDLLDIGFDAASRGNALRSQAAMTEWEGKGTASAMRTAAWGGLVSGLTSAGSGYLTATGRGV